MPSKRTRTPEPLSSTGLFDIVDGQQRLVTLTIMFAAMRDLARRDRQAKLAARLHELIIQANSAAAAEGARYQLAIASTDNEFLAANCQRLDGSMNPSQLEDLVGAQNNIIGNREQILARLEELPIEARKGLANFLIDHCYLVVITSPDIDSAYRVFTIVNQLGLALTAQDILKAALLESLPKDQREIYAERWRECLHRIGGGEAFESFLSGFRSAFGRGRQPVIAEIREIIDQQGSTQAFLDNLFLPAADVYAAMIGRDMETLVLPARARQLLGYLGWLGHSDWKPPVLLWLIRNRTNEAAMVDFLVAIERLAFGQLLLGTGGQLRQTRYNRVLAAIRNENAIPHRLLELTAEDQRNILFNLASGGKKKGGKVSRLVLLRMNEHIAGKALNLTPDAVTLEHILPENVPRTSPWRETFSGAQREHYWRSIGNMMALGLDANRVVRNAPFPRKLEVYRNDANRAELPINDDVLAATDWNPDAVQAREDRLLAIAVEMWQLTGRIDRKPPRA